MADLRDDLTWVTIELTTLGQQRAADGILVDDILEVIGAPFHWPVFLPSKTYTQGTKTLTVHLVEGYMFVATGYADAKYFLLEKKLQNYIIRVMSTDNVESGLRVLHAIPNTVIEGWRKRLTEELSNNLSVGGFVRILQGELRNLEGEVIFTDEDVAEVLVIMRSAEIFSTIPRCWLEPICEEK